MLLVYIDCCKTLSVRELLIFANFMSRKILKANSSLENSRNLRVAIVTPMPNPRKIGAEKLEGFRVYTNICFWFTTLGIPISSA